MKAWVIAAVHIVMSDLISLPWTIYTDWWRERGYGRTSQPLIDYLGQGVLALLIAAVFVALFFVGVYALMRRAGRFWWVWSGGLTAFALSSFLLAGPVFIEPLFNDYKPVPAGQVRDALVVMAQQADVPEDRIFVYDGSRQSNNFTANVSGIAGSARIAISDVAFKGSSLDEVKAVTGHEIGHYVLGHVWRTVIVLSALAVLFFFIEAAGVADCGRTLGVRVVGTEQNPRGLGPPADAIRDRCERIVAKMPFNACEDGLVQWLRAPGPPAPTDVVVAGCETHVCMMQTAHGLQRAGFHAWVAVNACGTRHPADHELALGRLRQSGAVLASVETIVFEWLHTCEHPRFREVLEILKAPRG